MEHTPIQFGSKASAQDSLGNARERRAATVCPRCAEHFSPDGRFCPFDAEALQAAPGWDPGLDPLLGTLIDQRYHVLSVLGEGGMGVVYETRHRTLGKRFALKALRKDLASDPEIAARFSQEARTAAHVSHPGLVEITDFGRLPSGQPFFVMELLEGRSLGDLIRRGGPIPASRALDIVRQIAEALGAAHEQAVVHRDLKPDNVHVAPGPLGRDRVTIVDFGLAKVIGASRLTRAGMVFGTPHYMSPEQAMGNATDHRADVYALGIVMYEMFTGRVPFEADSYMGVLTKHMYMTPTPPSQLPGIERLGILESIILRCLEKKPEHRYGSLRELLSDLDLAANGATYHPSAVRQRRVTPRSLLADELELPCREELELRAPRGQANQWPKWAWIALAALFIAGSGGVFLWPEAAGVYPVVRPSAATIADRRASAVASRPGAERLNPPAVAQQAASSASSSSSLTPRPGPVPGPVTEGCAVGSACDGPALNVNGRSIPHSAGNGMAWALAPIAHKKTPTTLGTSGIVDPWAK